MLAIYDHVAKVLYYNKLYSRTSHFHLYVLHRPISCMYIYYIIFYRKHHILEEIPAEIIMTKNLISISCIKHIA